MNMKKPITDEKPDARRFPEEAYEYQDDVTKEAVDKMRDEVEPLVKDRQWKVIDGFGTTR